MVGWRTRAIFLARQLSQGVNISWPQTHSICLCWLLGRFWSGHSTERSAPVLRVPISIFNVQHFMEKSPKFPDNFLSLYILRKLLRFFLEPDPLIISAVSALVAGLGFLIFYVWCFSEEAPKLSANFLIVILTFYERGVLRCLQTCWLYPRKIA